MAKIKILKLKVQESGNLKAFADIEIGGVMKIYGCKLVGGKNGEFIGFPSRKVEDKFYDIVSVKSDSQLYKDILEAITSEYSSNSGNDTPNPSHEQDNEFR